MPRPRLAQSLIFLSAVALAFAVRFASIDVRQVWLDEALTQYAVSLDWSGLIADRVSAGHSPLYFLTMKTLGLDGSDLRALRIASVVMDSIAAGVFAAVVAWSAGIRAGVLAALFYALNPLLLFWGQNARPYGMLMMWLAIGIAGAAGMIGGASQNAFARRQPIALSLGLGGAAATLTGGVIAAGIIALSPLAMPSLRNNRCFRKAWGRALIFPACVVVAMAGLISLPHAGAVQGIYWTTRYAPLSIDAVTIVLKESVAGDLIAQLHPPLALGEAGMTGLAALLLILFAVCIAQALRRRAATPQILPFAALGAGLPVVLLALSFGTSLLVGRYFLPAVAAAMMIGAVGAATLTRRKSGTLLVSALTAALSVAALNQSLSAGWPRNPIAMTLSGLILGLPQPGTRVLFNPDDDIGPAVQTQLLIDRLAAPEFPELIMMRDATGPLAFIGKGPVFLGVPSDLWLGSYAMGLPAPTCLWNVGTAVLAYWAEPPVPCPHPSG
jgi:energy-converting hydrogenase Eha subunit A